MSEKESNFEKSPVDYVDLMEGVYKSTSNGNWYVIEDETVETVWISSDDDNIHTVALLDYNGKEQNNFDASFIVMAKNDMPKLLKEIKVLRQRVLDLLEENTKEVNMRISLQKELEQLKNSSQDSDV